MVTSDGYVVVQNAKKNTITIYLPQTLETVVDTIRPFTNRKKQLTEVEEAVLLGIVKELYKEGGDG